MQGLGGYYTRLSTIGFCTAGGYPRSGLPYFEGVDGALSRVDSTFELVDATDGERFRHHPHSLSHA